MEKDPKKLSVSEAESILASNGMRTNVNHAGPYQAYHGGQQMRLVHTARGTYTAFVTDFGRQTWIGKFRVMKIDNENRVTMLYSGEYQADHSTTLVNIGQDVNGDVVVVAAGPAQLSTYVFDHETDAMTEYSAQAVFSHTEQKSDNSFKRWLPGYQQTMFDFARRKIYAFYLGGLYSGEFLLEWFTFDMETGKWSDGSCYKWFEGLRRHGYIYPLPDGKGGAYIVAERDDAIALEPKLKNTGANKYLWDELRLFHIPDLASPENITYTTIHAAYEERGAEGIWSGITNGHYGGVFMDAAGYLHVTYLYQLVDLSGQHPDLDSDCQYRHAIYRGMECVYNEKIDFLMKDPFVPYKALLAQDKNGTLFMLAFNASAGEDQVEIYEARDALGTAWKPVKTLTLPGGITSPAYSMSAPRDGSTQDGTVSCFCYCYRCVVNGERIDKSTVYIFTVSLDDLSLSGPVDVFDGFDLIFDNRMDRRAYSSAHTTKIVRTESGAYAAFVYNYYYDFNSDDYNYDGKREDFVIAKLAGGQAKILHTGSYDSHQNRYLTMRRMPDGTVAVFPPDGDAVCLVDPKTDKVAIRASAPSAELARQQTDAVVSGSARYALYSMNTDPFTLTGGALAADGTAAEPKTYRLDPPAGGTYTGLYTLADGKKGAYLVGTRICGRPIITHFEDTPDERGRTYLAVTKGAKYCGVLPEKLIFNGHTDTLTDSLALFYIPDLACGKAECIGIEPPYEAEGDRGIWSVADAANCGDAYLDGDGKLHVFYTTYHFDFNDAERRENPALIAKTLKHMHAVYDGASLVSSEELGIAGLTKDSSVRMAQTADGTKYLLVCNIGEAGARIDVYRETADGWSLAAAKPIGDFTAESFSVSGPRGGSVRDDTVDCLVYATDNDAYHVSVTLAL